MDYEHEFVDMWVLQFETLYGEPNHKHENIKSLQYLHKQTDLCTKGSFHENGQCNYIKIFNYIFSLRLLCEYFMIRIMKVLLKCSSMATKCANLIRWNTTTNFGFCNCHLQLKFSYMWHMQLQICVVA
jgi:hypothetical protein